MTDHAAGDAEARIAKAQQLLREQVLSITDVGRACGYKNRSTFITNFKRVTGMPPGVWRDQQPSDAGNGP